MQTGDRLAVRPATTEDVDELGAVVARAFEDDPLYAWVLPDPATRVVRSTEMMRIMAARYLPFEYVEISTTVGRSGVAIWIGPERWEPPTSAMLTAVPRLIRVLGPRGVVRMFAALGALSKSHPKDRPHWYLAGLATDPPHQRTGVGAALVTPVLDRCDREGLGAYLETQKADNVPYYERFGFRVTREIDLPLKGPHLWLMWRDPH